MLGKQQRSLFNEGFCLPIWNEGEEEARLSFFHLMCRFLRKKGEQWSVLFRLSPPPFFIRFPVLPLIFKKGERAPPPFLLPSDKSPLGKRAPESLGGRRERNFFFPLRNKETGKLCDVARRQIERGKKGRRRTCKVGFFLSFFFLLAEPAQGDLVT